MPRVRPGSRRARDTARRARQCPDRPRPRGFVSPLLSILMKGRISSCGGHLDGKTLGKMSLLRGIKVGRGSVAPHRPALRFGVGGGHMRTLVGTLLGTIAVGVMLIAYGLFNPRTVP